MAAIGALGDAPKTRGGSRRGLSLWQTSGALSSGTLAVTTPFTTVVNANAAIVSTAAPTTSEVTYSNSGATVTFYGWKASAAGTTTLVATTGTETLNVTVIGIL